MSARCGLQPTSETFDQQRARILASAPEVDPDDYDLAWRLGYEPESWDGMWKLPAENPFTRIGRVIIVHEVLHRVSHIHGNRFARRHRIRWDSR